MKILKILSLIGIIVYPIFFTIIIIKSKTLFYTIDKQYNFTIYGFICLIIILYSIIHIIFGCIQGYKNVRISLFIISIIGLIIYGIFLFLLILLSFYNNYNSYEKLITFLGLLSLFIPFALIISKIIFIISIRMIKNDNVYY